jgi:hypothetical protein
MGLLVTNSVQNWVEEPRFGNLGLSHLRVKWPQHQGEQLPQLTATQLYVVCLAVSNSDYIQHREKTHVLLLHPVSLLLTFQ